MNEKYFTERLFWLPNINELLHVYFAHGNGWFADYGYGKASLGTGSFFSVRADTYAGVMEHFNDCNPELLLQEEW